MKATAIQLRKSYEISVGRGATIVKVLDINPKTGAWICETQSGKEIAIGDPKRFLKAIDGGKGTKKKKGVEDDESSSLQSPESETAKKSPCQGDAGTSLPKEEKAVTSPSGRPEKAKESKPVADPEILEQLRKAVKEADKKLRTARNALQYGFIDQSKLDEATVEYDAACKALKEAGGVLGSGGRCLGQMSGRDAAYKVLCETGISMNGRQICEMALDQGYWEPQGETPEATIVSAMLTEIKRKGDAARFIRTGKGLFAAKQ
ncbi:MAG: winged helix-turn-helix domain-containing protein [Planctomycetaceae bacterium]|nr:winged helix-turn-helix domain-containing protein [Planctomycetaceae bacterium]